MFWRLYIGIAFFSFSFSFLNSPSVAAPLDAAVEFDQGLLWGSDQQKKMLDLSRFAQGNPILAGDQQVRLYVNDFFYRDTVVRFSGSEDRQAGDAVPCFTPVQILSIGLVLDKLSVEQVAWLTFKKTGESVACKQIQLVVPDSSARYEFSEQRLDVYIPQAYQLNRPKDYIDPALWDRGITAARMNYSLSLFQSNLNGQQDNQGFLQLESGFNWADWRFRHVSSLSKNEFEQRYQTQRTYAQTDIADLRSTLTVGDTYTDGQVFDSFGMRGLMLATDDRMLPASQRGYAPVVRGTANSNAKVSISQAGVLLYQKAVPPGPFEIKDLLPVGYGSDLQVTVTEADGQTTIFSVPYSATAQLLRPDTARVSSSVGQAWSSSRDHYNPAVAQLSVQYGLNNILTPYGGALVSEDYLAFAGGAAVSTPLGGLAADITFASNRLDNSRASDGSSVRLIYSTVFEPTNTNITLSNYRYSTEGYWSFNDMLQTEDSRLAGYQDVYEQRTFYGHQKNRFDVSLRQDLESGWGSFFLSGVTRNYWNREGADTEYQLSYNNRFQDLYYDISARRAINQYGEQDDQIRISISLPLSLSKKEGRQYLTGRAWNSNVTGSQGQVELSGVAGKNDEFNYTASTAQSLGGPNAEGSYGITGGYQGPHASVSGGVTEGDNYRQLNLGVSGGVLVHADGITFGQTLGETVALIKAENAEGARITNAIGASVDSQGYGVVPYISPYSRNRVELDPRGLSADLQFESTGNEVIPAAGAVVRINFATTKENSALISGHFPDGSPLPFGSEVRDQKSGATVGFVGQGGNIFVRGIQPKGVLLVSLSKGSECTIYYSIVEDERDVEHSSVGARGICQ